MYAATPCVIHSINAKDLEDLAQEDMWIKDRLQLIKVKIEKNLVDDIDYFTFPKRFLQDVIDKTKLEEQGKLNRKKFVESK